GYFSVSDEQVFAGGKSGKASTAPPTYPEKIINFNPPDITVGDINEVYLIHHRAITDIGEWKVKFRGVGVATTFWFTRYAGEEGYRFGLLEQSNRVNCETGVFIDQAGLRWLINPGTLPDDDWVEIKIIHYENNTFKVGWSAPGIEYTESEDCYWWNTTNSDATLEYIIFTTKGTFYFDEFGKEKGAGKVWGISPDSATEITNLGDNFTFGWQDLDDWDTLSVVFQNRASGIFSNAKEYQVETIGASGEKTLSFENFNFDRNGKFYFYAVATRTVLEVIEGMFLTGKYSYEWSDDLVDPDYWIAINIEGYTPIFEMSDFEEWYAVKSKFAEPTDMFFAIAGFFQPTFNKIGEFGNRIKDYFDLDEVYSQGYEIGKYIAYFTYFVDQISLFLGGFPILKWVFVVILLLTGIFIFRLVLKFIPFLG
ncbi:unnamed protein product, partial [marine sediment metagenome]